MNGGNVLPYIDVPFQHASPAVLKAMRRPAAQEKTLERIRAWRAICPDLTIRSTFIVGFPGETEEDFRFLLDWLDEAKLDRVGAFQYEPVKGAAANDLGLEPVPDEIKASRHKRFMQRAQAISAKKLAAKVGKRLEVIVDEGGARAGQGPQQGRRAADRRRRPHRDAPAVARGRHRDGQDRPLRRLRFVGDGGLRAARRDARDGRSALNRPEPISAPRRRRSPGRPRPIRSACWRSRPSPWRSAWRCSTAPSSPWRCRRWRASSRSRRRTRSGSSTPSSSRSPSRSCRWRRSATCSATGASIGGGLPSSPSPRSPARSRRPSPCSPSRAWFRASARRES